MRWKLAVSLPLVTLLAVGACSRQAALEAQMARDDLTRICETQRSYLETRKLLKNGNEKELVQERSTRFLAGTRSNLVKEALLELERQPSSRRRHPFDVAAAKVGFKEWSCPELDRL